MSKKAKVSIAVTVLASSVYLSGCGLLSFGDKEKIDPPQDVSYLKEGEKVDTAASKEGEGKDTASKEEAAEKTVMTELYLIDKNGYVVSQSLPLPNNESVAKQALEYLVVNGPVQNILPNGFRGVLPADTQVTVNIKDGKAIADFSPEFNNYQPEDEQKILQSVTWTLTQFDSVEKVELRVNGYPLTEMPVNGTPIDESGLSRKMGINVDTSGVADPTSTKPVTVYYVAQTDSQSYYVPVTKRVSSNESDEVKAVVQELIEGPGYGSSLASDFTGAALLDDPSLKDGTVTLNFNEAVYGSIEEKVVSEHMLNTLVLSLTEQKGVKGVSVLVNGEATTVSKDGEQVTEPVTRPENVNAISF
ncbi:GerMN domain-containing protein [Rossellomorea aquimaris]|uniref:GerMN domain-containing protein n=1 Tax=Rossellomorea aquimaris TaxID=189382 RepID=UPI001CD4B43F|nr:GerMN domain-containing protein [Rossellomorea aquimaris]MCA1056358.1 GerMN domain-containing protein [Rossellomorea aquimaris]